MCMSLPEIISEKLQDSSVFRTVKFEFKLISRIRLLIYKSL